MWTLCSLRYFRNILLQCKIKVLGNHEFEVLLGHYDFWNRKNTSCPTGLWIVKVGDLTTPDHISSEKWNSWVTIFGKFLLYLCKHIIKIKLYKQFWNLIIANKFAGVIFINVIFFCHTYSKPELAFTFFLKFIISELYIIG